jgi:hypothetical protein
MSDPTKQREAPISFRPTMGRTALSALAQSHGQSVNAFLNARLSGQRSGPLEGDPPLDPKTAIKLLAQVAKIMDWTRQDEPPTDPYAILLLEGVQQELEEIRTCLMQIAGREP